MMKTNRLRKQISLKTSLLAFAVGLVCAGWSAFRHSNYVSASMPADVARSETTFPSQFFALSPEANALIEAKVKGQERTLSDYLPGSADSRRRLDEISCKYNLSPEEQKHSDDLNRRTAESVELTHKNDYFPQSPN